MEQKWPAGTFNSVLTDFWKANIVIHDGEYEYLCDCFIRGAKTEEEARKEARYQAQHFIGDKEATPNTDFSQDNSYCNELNGYRLIELKGVRRIATFDELMENLFLVDYQEREVNCAGNSKSMP
jgi:hypothetical protein